MAYELPENLTALDGDALDAALNEALDAFRALNITAESDEDTIVEAERIAPMIRSIRAEQQSRVAAAEARTQRVNDLLADIPAEDAEAEAPQAEAEVEEEAPTPPQNEEAPVAENIPEPVAAAGSAVARAARNAPAPVVPRRAATIIASADVPGFATGQELDDIGMAGQALVARLRGVPNTRMEGVPRQRFGAAIIRKDYAALNQSAGQYDDYSLVQKAGEESRLPGGSLVAAGGWCSPSETVYDMCQLETVSGILDLPSIGITRGGLRYTQGPDFSDIYNQCGFHQTEDDAIAGECKTCCEVECPPFEEIRLEAVGYCVKVPILTNYAYPELIRRFTEGALVAHAHKLNAWKISQIVTATGAGVTVAGPTPVSFALDALELQAIGMRYQYRLGESASIEVVAPIWLKSLIRMDVARRTGVDWQSVTDAQIDSAFTNRNLKVQWVYDWQDLVVAGCVVTLPTTAQVLMYPAGTWVEGGSEIISMDAVYDNVGLESNTFTGVFVEESILVVQRCTHTCKVTIPICVSGQTGAADITACLTAAA